MTSVSGLDRREWIRLALQVAGGAAVVTRAGAATSAWVPQVLTSAENEALIATGERIIPGSGGALCNRVIDLVLTMESEQTRATLTGAIRAFANDSDGEDAGACLERRQSAARSISDRERVDGRRLLVVRAGPSRTGVDREDGLVDIPGLRRYRRNESETLSISHL